jgi:serine/threonine-protein kinase
MPIAKSEALRALELDEAVAEAYVSLAIVQSTYEWDFAAGEQSFRKAISLDPAEPTGRAVFGWFLACCGRDQEAVAQCRAAVELDPLNPYVDHMLSVVLIFARDYEAALTQAQKTLEIHSGYFPSMGEVATAHYFLGRPDDALRVMEEAKCLAPEDPFTLTHLGLYQAAAGRTGDALRTVEQLKTMRSRRYVSAFLISWPYLHLGEIDRAYEWLETALAERDGLLIVLKCNSKCNSLLEGFAKDPRYQDVLRRIGIP